MISDMGTTLLFIGMLLGLLQAGLWLLPRYTDGNSKAKAVYYQLLPATSIALFLVMSAAFGLLMLAFARSDFSVMAVYEYSHTLKPLLFKITGSWGNHEGSMLLWCWVLSLYTALLTLCTNSLPRPLVATALHLMGAINALFTGYLLFTSSPFTLLSPAPLEGMGLNPLLQDIGLAMHPPLLYLGYTGFAAAFALAFAALIHGNVDKGFAAVFHPWILLPWSLLTFGIGLGSWWAYRELGWGGWWFWDPVENASLLPWLTATALFHANLVMRKQGNFQRWIITLSLLTFGLSLFGTFLVRSGLLTSVHSFASDPTRGTAILIIISLITGGGLLAWYRYRHHLLPSASIPLLSRDMAVLFNNLLLVMAMVTTLLGMLYPLLMEMLTSRILTIGTDYYNHLFAMLTLPLLIACGLSSYLVWRHNPTRKLKRTQFYCLLASLACTLLVLWILPLLEWMGIALIFASLWVFITVFYRLIERKQQGISLRPSLPMVAGHTGLALFVLAATLNGYFTRDYEFLMSPDTRHTLPDLPHYQLYLEKLDYGRGENYVSRHATLELSSKGHTHELNPEERYYPVEEKFTNEASIGTFLTHDAYATIKRLPDVQQQQESSEETASRLSVQFHLNAAIGWIWGGFLLTGISGIMALWIGRNASGIPAHQD